MTNKVALDPNMLELFRRAADQGDAYMWMSLSAAAGFRQSRSPRAYDGQR